MTKREHIRKIIDGENVDYCGFWLGNPHTDTWPLLHDYFGTSEEEELRKKLGDEFRWICPQMYTDVYQDPDGRTFFDEGLDREKHAEFPLADCEDIKTVEAYPWPKTEYLNFESCLADLKKAGDVYRASGFWTCFYHNIMDLFGMENYMIKMYTHPEVVEVVTDKVCQFYYDANELFFAEAGNLVDGFFFGNDFGTQRDLICGPDQFNQFIMPWFEKFTQQAHKHNYQALLHSCGAIYKVIPTLIDAGVDCLHPLQAKAENMDADSLKKYKGKIAFMGGIDTQNLLVNGSPVEIKEDVKRVKNTLGPNLIISPSHECILPNIPVENIEAMAEEAVNH
jgi:uroporphyrinogen decarboxylase